MFSPLLAVFPHHINRSGWRAKQANLHANLDGEGLAMADRSARQMACRWHPDGRTRSKIRAQERKRPSLRFSRHRSIEDAARACDYRTQDAVRWLKVPEFRAAYLKARRAALIGSRSHDCSRRLARRPQPYSSSWPTRPRRHPRASEAAGVCHCMRHKAIEIEDLDTRLSILERATETAKGRRSR